MAIAFRSVGATNAGGVTSLVIPMAAGVANGDVLIMEVSTDPNGQVITTPAGWNVLVNTRFNGNLNGYGLFWRVAASEPANYTVSVSASGVIRGAIFAYTGVSNAHPIDVVGATNTGSGTTVTALGVTTVTTNTLVIFVHGNNNNASTMTTPASFTSREKFIGVFVGQSESDRIAASAAATGNATLTLGAAFGWISYMFALQDITNDAVAKIRNRAMIAGL